MGLFTTWVESLYEPNKITDKCLKHISPKSSCKICMDLCPPQAIQLDKTKKPIINLDACDDCQLCVTSCPPLAIEGNLPKRKYLEDTLVINQAEPIFNERELLFLYRKGIRYILNKTEDGADIPDRFSNNITKVNEILQIMGLEQLQYSEKLPDVQKEEKQLSRRDFFSQLRTKSQKTILANYTPASWRNNHHLLDTNRLFPEIAFFHIEINKDTCTLCNICTSLCPEKCFEKKSDEAAASFLISHKKCIGCMLCIDICPENSITIEEKISMDDLEEAYSIFENKCEKCGDAFQTWEETNVSKCPVCIKTDITFAY